MLLPLSRDADSVDMQIQSVLNPKTRAETMRLRDVALIRRKMSRPTRDQLMRNLALVSRPSLRAASSKIAIVPPMTAISTSALPVPWSVGTGGTDSVE
jgi:hypothetical protein